MGKVAQLLNIINRKFFAYALSMQSHVNLGKNVSMSHRSKICSNTDVGDFTRIDGTIIIKGKGKAKIGKYCAIGDNVKIITSNHKMVYANVQITLQKKMGFTKIDAEKGETVIGNAVWIGDNTIILPGVIIGDGAVVGAGSVVTKEVPEFTVAAGVPANRIKERFEKSIIDYLRDIQWWNWSEDRIARNKEFFEMDLTKSSVEDIKRVILQ